MAALSYNPFEGDGVSIVPHRPDLDGYGGNEKADDQQYPPSAEEPSANEWNRFAEMMGLNAQSFPLLQFTVAFSAGYPYYTKFWCANSNFESTDFTLTDNAAGDTTITYPADCLPVTPALDPMVSLNEHGLSVTPAVTIDTSTRQIRVTTSSTDAKFTVVVR